MGKVIDEAEGALNKVAMAAQAAFEPRHDD
jgi:hypothetical protein